MKSRIFILIAIALFSVSCQETIDIEAEKKAIIDVINSETQAYMDLDFEKVTSFYVKDSLNFRLTTGADNHVYLEGWDQIEAFFENEINSMDGGLSNVARVSVVKEDFKIKVYEKSAFVVCTETWTYNTDTSEFDIESRQVRFMEKVDDDWKISFLSFVGTSGYQEEEVLDDMGLEFNSVK